MFASSKYIAGMGLFSQLTDLFFSFFCAKWFSAWAQSSYRFDFFPWVLLGGLFFCSLTRVSVPYPCPSSTQWSSWYEQIDHWTGVQRKEFGSKADGRYPQKRTFPEQHQTPETYKGWGEPEVSSSPEVCVTLAHDIFQLQSRMFGVASKGCKQKYSQDTSGKSA